METITARAFDSKDREWKILFTEVTGIRRASLRDPPDVEILEIQVNIKGKWFDVPMDIAAAYVDLHEATS